jgi:hypothetical protein
MSPPTPEQQDAALASLAGNTTERKPVTDLDRDLMRLRLVSDARLAGIPWAAIGASLGMSGKECKAAMKRLAAKANRELVLAGRPTAPEDGEEIGLTATQVPASAPPIAPESTNAVREMLGFRPEASLTS